VRRKYAGDWRAQPSGRNGADSEEQQQVEEQQVVIRAPDVTEHAVMVHPHDADEREAQHKGNMAGPRLKQQLAEPT
jgi:hypothetical protein